MTRRAYLTIDDSPSIFMKEKVDFLKFKKIPALFFCRGDYMENNPESVIYAIKNGFVVGNHSYSHSHFSNISVNECLKEISKTETIIENLYHEANVKRHTKYFRYPFGTKGDIIYGSLKIIFRKLDRKFLLIEKHLKKLGYKPLKIDNYKKRFPEYFMLQDTDTSWTFDIGEWKVAKNNIPISRIEKRIDDNLANIAENEIFLIHDHELTHQYFEKIVFRLMEMRYDFLEIK